MPAAAMRPAAAAALRHAAARGAAAVSRRQRRAASGGVPLDTVVRNVRVVRPDPSAPILQLDLGARDGRWVEIAESIDPSRAAVVHDAAGMLGFPGVCDAHTHVGIYQELEADARQESKAAAMGGVTTMLSYMRTGQYYLNKSGPWKDFLPEVRRRSDGNFYVDYCYHLAPIEHSQIGEMGMAHDEFGCTSFKIFMFYGGYGLHGASDSQADFLMTKDKYDMAHFEFIMRELSQLASEGRDVSLSLHCEIADILRAYTQKVMKGEPVYLNGRLSNAKLSGLKAYSAARPQHSEGLAVFIASFLANETNLKNINLLHLTSKSAVQAALQMQALFPHINFRREVTIGHLLLDTDSECGGQPLHAKVNPPIRPREDVEYLWEQLVDGKIDWVVSDHACCSGEQKVHEARQNDVFSAKSGFGGTEWLLPGLFSEGTKRGLTPQRIAALTSRNVAERYGLHGKGDIAIGKDADLALLNPTERFVVRGSESISGQGYTPMEGLELTGRVKKTLLRGSCVYSDNGAGKPGDYPAEYTGKFLSRPYRAA
eukprot:TRINITY_DN1843_c0_g1_i1.p2 TRINITY_DN1843_c0_g1~~TRINITY_DN1843_c0_g1_i1.p2  ORF type:complete len:541 (+),score=231.78 TRINITY_DN1843_c0_g1_i1:96-1718(+)